jgi:WD40 repeat protein
LQPLDFRFWKGHFEADLHLHLAMPIVRSNRGTPRIWDISELDFVFGPAHENSLPLLDLSPDMRISCLHARIGKEDGEHRIEDLQSSRETLLNRIKIKDEGRRRIENGDASGWILP